MKKKLTAILLSIATLLSILPIAGLSFGAAAETTVTELVAYVVAGTTTTGEVDNEDAPYATISDAITALDAIKDTDTETYDRIVKVKGTYTCEVGVESFDATNSKFCGLATHENLITIEGNDPTDATALVDITGVCSAGGPLKFDNIHFNITNNTSVFYAGGFPVEFGPNAVPHYTSGGYGRVASGGYHQGLRTDYETRVHDLTTNQSFNHVILGDNNPNKIYTIPGVNYAMNGGTVSRLAVGSSKDTYPNHFTGNVNVELNGGKVEQVRMGANSYFFATYASGVAVQIIANNGMALNTWYYNSTTSTTPPTITDADGNANLYLLKVEKNDGGSTLSATATKGVYTVNKGEGYIPVVKDASGNEVANAYNATAGTVTVYAAGVYTVSWELTGDVIAYVKAGTTTAGEIGNADAPYATISEAITALDALTGSINRLIEIIGAYTCEPGVEAFSNNQFYGFATHENLITIESNAPTDATALVDITGVCSAGGPLKFDNIHFNITNNTSVFYAGGFPVEFGPNAVPHYTSGGYGRVASGGYHQGLRTDYETRVHDLTTNQSFNHVILGDNNPNKIYTIPGVNYVMNGGTVSRLAVGSSKDTYPNHFTGNVNVELNGGTVEQVRMGASSYFFATYASGVAVQIIANNGMALNTWYYNSTTSTTPPTITDADGTPNLYVLKVAANTVTGATLKATSTTGKYALVDAGPYTAVAKDESGNTVAESVDGYLSIPQAGIYTVTWVKEIVGSTVYVDGTKGDDALANGSLTAPFKTINAAITVLDALDTDDDRVVKIVGTYSIGDAELMSAGNRAFAAHGNPITLAAADESSELYFAVTLHGIGGPLTIDLPYRYASNNYEFCAFGHELTFGENAVCDTAWGTWGRVASGQYANLYDASMNYRDEPHKLTVKNGKFSVVYVGHSPVVNDKTNTIAGASVLLEGGDVPQVIIGGNTWSHTGQTIYTDDINITVNGGKYKQFALTSKTDVAVTTLHDFQEGAALQILFNHGLGAVVNTLPTVSEVAAAGGSLYVLKSAKETGSYLETTGDAGKYTVVGGKTAVAINEADTGLIYYSENGTLTIDKPGIYAVTYREDYALIDDEIVFFQDTTVSLADLPYKEMENKLFIGWMCGESIAQAGAYTAGQVLTPVYIDCNTESDFLITGTEIRASGKAVRYVVQYSHTLADNAQLTDVTFGAAVLPDIMLKGHDLTLNTSYAYNGGSYASADVKAENLYKVNEAEGWTQYTACLYNIPLKKYQSDYAVRGYMTYTDINGVQRTAYTAPAADSLSAAAERLLAIEPTDELASGIVADGKANKVTTVAMANTIVCWGSSSVQGYVNCPGSATDPDVYNFPAQLYRLITAQSNEYTVLNAGCSGEESIGIMSRQGAEEAYTQFDFVFAAGVTEIELSGYDTSGRMDAGFVNGDGVLLKYMSNLGNELSVNNLVIDGKEYTLNRPSTDNGNKYTLSRADATEEVTIPANTPITFASESSAKANYCDIYYLGANDGDYDDPYDLVEKYQKTVAYRNDDCYLIVIPPWSDQFDAAFEETFGDHAVNFREYAIKLGYEPRVDPYGAGLLNDALFYDVSADRQHLNETGYGVLAEALYTRGQELGYWD